MSKFKVGDKVNFRNDLIADKSYGGICFLEEMKEHVQGKEMTISIIDYEDTTFKVKNDCLWYSFEMLEEPKKEFTFEEVIARIQYGETYVNTKQIKRLESISRDSCGNLIFKAVTTSEDSFGVSEEDCFRLKENKERRKIFLVEHAKNGKRYEFRTIQAIFNGDMVICDTKYGKSYGKVVDIVFKELTEKEYLEFKRIKRVK